LLERQIPIKIGESVMMRPADQLDGWLLAVDDAEPPP
jgi:hypothetical protein